MRLEGKDFLAIRNTPESQRAVRRDGGQQPAVWRKGDTGHHIRVTLQDSQGLGSVDVPDADGRVARGRDNNVAIQRAEPRGSDGIAMPAQRPQQLARLRVPQLRKKDAWQDSNGQIARRGTVR